MHLVHFPFVPAIWIFLSLFTLILCIFSEAVAANCFPSRINLYLGIFSLFRSINLFDASPVWWDVKWTDGQLKTFQSTFSRFQSNLDTSYKQAHPNKISENFLQNFCNDDMFFRSDQSIGYLELSWISQIIIYIIC